MPASTVLREYLVRLGFHVDNQSWDKFVGAMKLAAGGAGELGTEVLGAATLATAAVNRIGSQYLRLVGIANRSGQSVAYLRSYQLASEMIGISADEAADSVDRMGIALRTNPGLRALGQHLTGKATPAPYDLVQALRGMPDFLGIRYAEMFGMSADEYLRRKMPVPAVFDEAQKYYGDLLREAGLTTKESIDQWVEVTRAIRYSTGTFDLVSELIIKDLVKSGVVQAFTAGMKNLGEGFVHLDKELSGGLGLFTAALGVLLGELTLEGIIGKVLGGPKPVTRVLGASATAMRGGLLGTAALAVLGMKQDAASGNKTRSWLRDLLGIPDENEPAPWQPGGAWHTLPVKPGAGTTTPATRALAESLMGSVPGIERFTSFQDEFHKSGAHAAGRALDFTLKDPTQAAAVADAIRVQLAARGVDAQVINEYDPRLRSPNATGGHIHVGLNRVPAEWSDDAAAPPTVTQNNNTTINLPRGADVDDFSRAVDDANQRASQSLTRAMVPVHQ